MIESYKVTVLRMGLLKDVDYSQIVYLKDMGKKMDFPVWAVLLQGNGKQILVDMGIFDPDWASKNILKCIREEIDHPAKALKMADNLNPEDVDYVIFTHLHWDHIGDNLKPFKKARFVVQDQEWRYMFAPVSYQKWAYQSSLGVCLDRGLDFFQWYFVTGWVDFLPGIKLIPTPGHTPGSQVVLVKTEEGSLAIAGDAMNMIDNLELDLPSGITTNGEDYMKSMALIRKYADYAIGGHELALEPFQSKSFPKVRRLQNKME
jgi:N-acyl homoserine lactone hydrolase